MEVRNLQLNKWYLVQIDDNLLKSRYDGQFHEYRDNIYRITQEVINRTYYRFFYYRFNEGEFYYRHMKEEDVIRLVQEIPFNYRSMYGGIGGLKRWFNQLTNLLV